MITALRKKMRPLRRLARFARKHWVELPYKFGSARPGSAAWLIRKEVQYGGLVQNVPRLKVSPRDGRTADQLEFGGMTGGDRMLHNGYGRVYAQYLAPFLSRKNLTIAEFGILKGTGLAIWCDLFSKAEVLGLDIDLSHFDAARPGLERRGAFKSNFPELHVFDQLADSDTDLARILAGRKLDIIIDDGLHSIESITRTWSAIRPHVSERFVFFIEDYSGLLEACPREFREHQARSFGLITVISAGIDLDAI